MATKIYSLDGNIGSGKSTLLKRIHDLHMPNVVTVFEPIDEWMSMKPDGYDKSIFEMYYENKQRYAFMFQLYALQSRITNLVNVVRQNPGKIIITERCHLTDCQIFAKMLLEDDIMTRMEYQVYKSWYDFVVQMIPRIHGIIYINASPETCAVRIIKRHRTGEDKIDIRYLEKLHKYHQDWLMIEDTKLSDIQIHVVDGNKSPLESSDVAAVLEFVNKV